MNEATSNSPASLVIRLDQLDSPQQFQTVHSKALQRLVEQVDAGLQRHRQQASTGTACCTDRQPWLESLQPLDQGHTSFIDGTRGAGKTTFLRAACRALCKELQTTAEPAPPAVAQSTLCFLGLMDPSRVETGEKILLNVVRAVQRRVEHCTPCFGERARQDATQQFRATLEKLAAGLSLLRQDHDPLKDVVDPEVFVSVQLARVDEGEMLRCTFHTLLDHACHVLKADALVLAFDDADTSAHKGSEVMECLRKYLNSPRLVVLVAGDMELYAQLARRKMVENVGKEVEGAKPERQTQHHRMLDHLEEQYLLKVFPVQRRHRLVPLKNLPEPVVPPAQLLVQWQPQARGALPAPGPQKAALADVVAFTLKQGLFCINDNELAPHRDYFLSLPLRTVLQVLARCAPLLVVEDSQVKLNGPAEGKQAVFALLQAFQHTFTEAVRTASLVNLYAHGVDVDGIAQDHFPALIKGVVDVVLDQGNLDTGAYLRPTSTSESLNACFFALSAEVARLCMGRPDRAIAYMLMGPGTVSAYQMTQQASNAVSNASATRAPRTANSRGIHHHPVRVEPAVPSLHARHQPSLEEFKRYMRVGVDDDVMAWSWRAAPLFFQPITAALWRDRFEPFPESLKDLATGLADQGRVQSVLTRVYLHQVRVEQSNDILLWSGWTALALLSTLWATAFDGPVPPVDISDKKLTEWKADQARILERKLMRQIVRTAGGNSTGIPPWQVGSGTITHQVGVLDYEAHLEPVVMHMARWIESVGKMGHEGVLLSAAHLGITWASLHFATSGQLVFQVPWSSPPANLCLLRFRNEIRGHLSLTEVPVAKNANKRKGVFDVVHLLDRGCLLVRFAPDRYLLD